MTRAFRFAILTLSFNCPLFAAQKFDVSTVLPVQDSVPPLKVSGDWTPPTPLDEKTAAVPQIIVFRAWMETGTKKSFMSFNSSLAPANNSSQSQRSAGMHLPGLTRQLNFSRPRFNGVSEAWITLVYNPPSASKRGSIATPRIVSARPVILDKKKEAALREMGWKENALWVSALIDSAGNPKVTEVHAPASPTLVELLAAELTQWKFAPAREGGKPVPAVLLLPVLFVKNSSLPNSASRLKNIDDKSVYWLGIHMGNFSQPETDSPVYALEAPEIELSDNDLQALLKAGRKDLTFQLKIDSTGKAESVSSTQDDGSVILRILKKNLPAWRFSVPRENGKPASITASVTARVMSQAKDKSDAPKLLADHLHVYPDELRELNYPAALVSVATPPTSVSSYHGIFPTNRHFGPAPFSPEWPHPRSSMGYRDHGFGFASERYRPVWPPAGYQRPSLNAWDPFHRTIRLPSPLLAREPQRIRGKLSGHANVRFTVDENGAVTTAQITESTSPLFDAPAVRATLARIYDESPGRDPIQLNQRLQFFTVLNAQTTQQYMAFIASPLATHGYDNPPVTTFHSPPIFPHEMLMTRTNGRAVADVHIDTKGTVTRVDIAEASHPEFGAALQAALEMCTFKPAQKDGLPVRSIVRRVEEFTWFGKAPSAASLTRRLSPQERPATTIAPAGSAFVTLTVADEDIELNTPTAELDSEPQLLTSRLPRFPATLPSVVTEGFASIEFMINREGLVRIPRILQASDPSFGYAALQSVAFWGYTSSTRAGTPVTTSRTVTVRFSRTTSHEKTP